MSGDVPEAVVGDWQAGAYTISFSGGTYSVVNTVARTTPTSSCAIPAGMVIATFSGSGGSYAGHDLGWFPDCSTTWLPASFTLRGDSLTFVHMKTGVTEVWHRPPTAPLASPTPPAPAAFRTSIPTLGQVNLSLEVVIETLALAAVVIILVPFPGALFNSTLEANYAEISGRLHRTRRRARNVVLRPWDLLRQRLGRVSAPVAIVDAVGEPLVGTAAVAERHDFWWTPFGVGLFVFLTALLSGFLDPAFGLNAPSVLTFVGMLLGLVIVLAAFDLPLAVFYRRRSVAFWLRALPATLAVSIACVLISRLTDFHPGYLYGLVIAIVAAGTFDKPTQGRLMAAGVASTIAVAVIAWLALGIVGDRASASPDPGAFLVIAQTMLSMVVAAGVELAAFGMLPLSFLAGDSVKRWSTPVWAGLLGFGWIAFGFVILNPRNGYLSDTTRTPLFTIVALLVLFAVGSLLFWLYFQRRPAVAKGPAPEVQAHEAER